MVVVIAGLLAGAVSMWIFRRIADTQGIREAVNRIQASLLEFWLYVDDPAMILKSWRSLLAANARLLRLVAVPAIVISVPMVPLFLWLEASYGHSPLPVNRPAVVTVQVNGPTPTLIAPEGIAIETPPVRVPSEHQVSWRIRPTRALTRNLRLRFRGTAVDNVEVSYPSNPSWILWFLAAMIAGGILEGFRKTRHTKRT